MDELGLEVKFAEVVSDSRCPLNAHCLWPGIADIRLRIIDLPADTHFVTISIIGDHSTVPYEALLPVDTLGYRFTLLELDPYPGTRSYAPDEVYIAALSVYPYEPMEAVDGEIRITDQSPAIDPDRSVQP